MELRHRAATPPGEGECADPTGGHRPRVRSSQRPESAGPAKQVGQSGPLIMDDAGNPVWVLPMRKQEPG